MCLLDLFQGMEGGWGDHWHCMSLFGGIFVGTFKYEKWGDHRNKKLFINKSVKALILFKKWHQGLWKLHMALRGYSTVMEKLGLQKEDFVWSRKMTCEEACQPIEILCIYFLETAWSFLMRKWGGNRRKWFYSEMWGNPVWGGRGACENLMDGPIETAEYIWWIFGGCLIEFCHKTAEIHFLCIKLIN